MTTRIVDRETDEKIEFDYIIDQLPGCCGVCIIGGFYLVSNTFKKHKSPAKKVFDEILRIVKLHDYTSYIISTIPPGGVVDQSLAFCYGNRDHYEKKLNLYDIAKAGRMRKFREFVNTKTGNTVIMFSGEVSYE